MVNVQMYSNTDAHRAIGLSSAWCRLGWLATKWSSVDQAWWTCSPPWAAASRHGTSEGGSGDILRVRSFDQGLCRRLACRSSMLGSRSLLANRLDLLPNSLFDLWGYKAWRWSGVVCFPWLLFPLFDFGIYYHEQPANDEEPSEDVPNEWPSVRLACRIECECCENRNCNECIGFSLFAHKCKKFEFFIAIICVCQLFVVIL